MNHTVEIVPYDPSWPALFEKEAEKIRLALGDNCIAVHHIGSTSIPHLSAKPILDILPVVKNILHVDEKTDAMEKLGYEVKGECGVAFRRHFYKGKEVRTHNVHTYEQGDPEISRHLKFRDWMRSHPDDAQKYETLKKTLAKQFPSDVFKYCQGKEAFIADIDAKDGFSGWRMVQALTNREWESARTLLLQCPSETPFHLFQKDSIHFVFYKNSEIIGYVELILSKKEALLKTFVIDLSHRNFGFGSLFLKLCERWLIHQGIQKLNIQNASSSYSFYVKRGYISEPIHKKLYKILSL